MKLVLNIGMHKTGSSSIQMSLRNLSRNGFRYLQIGHPNNSAIYATLFMDQPQTYGAHRKNSRSAEEVFEIRERFMDRYENFLEESDAETTVLSSAEDLMLLSELELNKLREWAEERFSEIKLIGYARPPVSFMKSALQQRIVGGVRWNFKGLYPEYKSKFEKFDKVFGRDKVRLIKFDRDHLFHGDVVRDFAERAGLKLKDDEVVVANESRSLETTAALFAQRTLGRGWINYQGAPADNNRLVRALKDLGVNRITLHPDLVEEILEPHTDDLDWISERLGVSFADRPAAEDTQDPNAIRSLEDLLKFSESLMPGILDLLQGEIGNRAVEPELVAKAVDLLFDVIRSKRA